MTYLSKSMKAMCPWYKPGFFASQWVTLYTNLACNSNNLFLNSLLLTVFKKYFIRVFQHRWTVSSSH